MPSAISPGLHLRDRDANHAARIPGSMDETSLAASLYRLARVARGQEAATIDVVSRAARAILAAFFWSDAVNPARVEHFYDTDPLGLMLIRAKWLSVRMEEAMSIESAAAALALETATLRLWMFNDTIEFIRDDETGQLYTLGADVDRMRAKRDQWVGIAVGRDAESVSGKFVSVGVGDRSGGDAKLSGQESPRSQSDATDVIPRSGDACSGNIRMITPRPGGTGPGVPTETAQTTCMSVTGRPDPATTRRGLFPRRGG